MIFENYKNPEKGMEKIIHLRGFGLNLNENTSGDEDENSIVRIQSYKEFLKRKILVIHMKTPDLNIENRLKILNIPFISLSYSDPDLVKKIKNLEYFGIIISGSRTSNGILPGIPEEILKSNLPKLGICYGAMVIAQELGASIKDQKKEDKELSSPVIAKLEKSPLFDGIDVNDNVIVTMNHHNVFDCPKECKIIASTKKTPVAAFEKIKDKIFGIQFHPEKGMLGNLIFKNFFNICKKNEEDNTPV
jgi:GMP synthase-like glutamine amidotransferase